MQVANVELFQALARHGGLDRLDVLTHVEVTGDQIRDGLLGPELEKVHPLRCGAIQVSRVRQ
jgi:hypothetical protein